MLIVKKMRFRNLILLMVGITNAFNRHEGLALESNVAGAIFEAIIGNETSVIAMPSSHQVESANLFISTLTVSTCTCEPKGPYIIDKPGVNIPNYEGDEWDRYGEVPKMTSSFLNPDYVIRTNFSTSAPYLTNGTEASVTYSGEKTMTGGIMLSSTFPRIHITSTRDYGYNTNVYHNVSFNTGDHKGSFNTGYHNISSTIDSLSLSTYLTTPEGTTIDETSFISSDGIITPVTETEILQVTSLTSYDNITSTIDHSSLSTTDTTQAYETVDKSVEDTSSEGTKQSIMSTMETEFTTGPNLVLYHPTSTSHDLTTHSSYMNKSTTKPESKWSDYWSDENWSDEWPSELWSDVYKETYTSDSNADWKTTNGNKKHSAVLGKTTDTYTDKKKLFEPRSTSRVQDVVRSARTGTHATEGSFRILPTSDRPKDIYPSTESTSQEYQTEHLSSSEPISITSESYEHISHTTETSSPSNSKSKEMAHMSSSSENEDVSLESVSSTSISPILSKKAYISHTTEELPTVYSRISPSMPTHSSGGYTSGSSYRSKTSSYPKLTTVSSNVSVSPKATTTFSTFSRTHPKEGPYSQIFTSSSSIEKLILKHSRPAKPSSRSFSSEKTTSIAFLLSKTMPETTVSSSYLEQTNTSNENSLTSTNENMSSTLARPWNISIQNNETKATQNESNASSAGIYYFLIVPFFTFLVLL